MLWVILDIKNVIWINIVAILYSIEHYFYLSDFERSFFVRLFYFVNILTTVLGYIGFSLSSHQLDCTIAESVGEVDRNVT